jgi:dephospho-CoA kinase
MRIGLTGGIGCGKTAAAACFGRQGFQVICADRLAHAALLDPALVREIQARWGDEVLLENGMPDRELIAALQQAKQEIDHQEAVTSQALSGADQRGGDGEAGFEWETLKRGGEVEADEAGFINPS